MAASCEPVDYLRENPDFLLLAQRRAGTVPIFLPSFGTKGFDFTSYLRSIFCHVSSFRLLFLQLSCHAGLCFGPHAFPACLLPFPGRELQFFGAQSPRLLA